MSANTTARDQTPASTMAQSLMKPSTTSLKSNIDSPKATTIATPLAALSNPPKSLKRPLSPSFDALPPLTGAAAMAENRQREQDEEQQRQHKASMMTSANPAMMTKNTLMGNRTLAQPLSNSSSSSSAASNTTSNPPPRATTPASGIPTSTPQITTDASKSNEGSANNSAGTSNGSRNAGTILPHVETTNEPMSIGAVTQTSPVSMSGSEANMFAVHESGSVGSSKTGTSAEFSNAEDKSNKALTYPPQIMPDHESAGGPPTPARGMSVPGSSSSNKTPGSSRKHRCPECSTEFTRHHNLKSHLLTHSQEKPYECQQCPSRFRRLHDLKRHIRLHTGERPHECNICKRKFARGDALARHSRGPGGCAGRRGSTAGGDGDLDDSLDPDMSMDGVEYTGSNAGDEDDGRSIDGSSPAYSARRRSEPNRMRKQSAQHGLHSSPGPSSAGPYRQHSSTYPGVQPPPPSLPPPAVATGAGGAVGRGSPRPSGYYPPGASLTPHDNPSMSSSSSNRHLSPKSAAIDRPAYFNSNHNPSSNTSANMFAHGGMTESPKSLSPGGGSLHHHHHHQQHHQQPQQSHGGDSTGQDQGFRGQSPSLTTQLQQQHLSGAGSTPGGTGRGGGSSGSRGGGTLPSTSGVSASSALNLPPITGIAQGTGLGSSSSSSSNSHSANLFAQHPNAATTSAGLTSGSAPATTGAMKVPAMASSASANSEVQAFWDHMRAMEGRLADMQAQMKNQEQQYQGRITELQDELTSLKGDSGSGRSARDSNTTNNTKSSSDSNSLQYPPSQAQQQQQQYAASVARSLNTPPNAPQGTGPGPDSGGSSSREADAADANDSAAKSGASAAAAAVPAATAAASAGSGTRT